MSSSGSYIGYLYTVSNSFQYYAMWIILPTCIVGNLISLYIYSRPNLNKKTNTGFLYSWLCILNILTIVYYSVVFKGNSLFKYTLSLPCGMDNYIRRTALNSITWMQVVICLDRFIAVVYPTKTVFMSKKVVLYGIMLACLALILITNMTNLMTYPGVSTSNYTSSTCSTTNDVNIATNLIANLMRVFIPFGLMLTLNLLVIYRLKQSKIKVGVTNLIQVASKFQNSSNQPYHQITNKEFRFMVSTIIIDFVFLFFYLPLGVNYGIATYNLFSTSLTSNSLWSAAYNLFSQVTQMLAISHTSVLIFVFIIFNRNFRIEFILLFRLDKLFPSLQPDSSTNQTRTVNIDASQM